MKYWLKWLAVLPAATVAGLLILIPVHFVLYRSLTGSGLITPYPELPERLVSPFFTGLAFVWAGAYIAPSHTLRTAKALLATWVVSATIIVSCITLSGIFGPLDRLNVTWLDTIKIAGGMCGAYAGYYLFRSQCQNKAELGIESTDVTNTCPIQVQQNTT